MKNIFKAPLLLLLLLNQNLKAQHKNFKIPDSLQNKSIDYVIDRLDENEADQFLDSLYANTYLYQAKKANDPENIVNAYNVMLHKSPKETWLQYCDSMLSVAAHSKHDRLIGSAYLTRGFIYNSFKQQTKALDDYILADKFIVKTNDQYLIHKNKFAIAQIKFYLGYYNESLSLLKECENYFRINEPGIAHLRTLHLISLCYIKTKQYALATATNDLGYRLSVDMDEPLTLPYFINSEGRNEYFKENYQVAIEKLKKSLPEIIKFGDYSTISATYFFLGRSYWTLGEKEKAIPYLKKVDDLFREESFIKDEVLEAYDLIAQYYEEKGNTAEQLKYLTGLLKAETFVSKNFRYLSENMHREYDLKKISETTKSLKRELYIINNLNIILIVLFILVSAIFSFIIFRQYKGRKIRKQKFKGVVSYKDHLAMPRVAVDKIIDGEQVIKSEIIEAVSKKLEQFESSEAFLDKDFNLNKMAAFVDCNTRYTSRIICETRKKKYIEYVDDLRIDYILRRLKNDSKYRNYTIKALTEEAGFKSPQKFKEAFIKATELTPVYFIKELKKQTAE